VIWIIERILLAVVAEAVNRHLGVQDTIQDVVRVVRGEPVALMGKDTKFINCRI
jgi:hypothetical protein